MAVDDGGSYTVSYDVEFSNGLLDLVVKNPVLVDGLESSDAV